MTSIFLGAGFSKWAADLPLVNQLFDFEITNIRYNDEKWFEKLRQNKLEWDKNNDIIDGEAYIKYVITRSPQRMQSYLNKYIARRLTEQFLAKIYGGSLLSLMIDDSLVDAEDGVLKARNFIESLDLDEISGIITTNYDMIIEYALGTKRFTYGKEKANLLGMGRNRMFPWQNTPVITSGKILLAKIHGSISYDGESYWTTAKPGINGKSVILPPSPEKTRDLRFLREWKNAESILRKSHKLIIFGFNFNEYDQAVLKLLKTCTSSIEVVHIYDIESKLSKAEKIWDVNKIKEFKVT